MKLKTLLLITASTIFTDMALASEPPQWLGTTTVEQIEVQPNGRIYIKVGASTPDLGCPGNVDQYLEFDTDAAHFEEQFSMLLAAHMSNRNVQIYVNLCGHYPYAQNTVLN